MTYISVSKCAKNCRSRSAIGVSYTRRLYREKRTLKWYIDGWILYIRKIKIITLFLQIVDFLLPRNWNLEVQNKLWDFIFSFCLPTKNNFTDQSYNIIAKCQLLFKLLKCFIFVTSFDVSESIFLLQRFLPLSSSMQYLGQLYI